MRKLRRYHDNYEGDRAFRAREFDALQLLAGNQPDTSNTLMRAARGSTSDF